jgi:hypothetical protein
MWRGDANKGREWFGQFKATIAITTYQVGKVIFFGLLNNPARLLFQGSRVGRL